MSSGSATSCSLVLTSGTVPLRSSDICGSRGARLIYLLVYGVAESGCDAVSFGTSSGLVSGCVTGDSLLYVWTGGCLP